MYIGWFADKMRTFVSTQAYVGKFLAAFKEFATVTRSSEVL